MTIKNTKGFTLVELSIVLVIIGLIVGGILSGKDLIEAAQVRAQISQITSYNTATNTFREKYNGLPGDLLNGATFFSAIVNQNSSTVGMGNGDNLIENSGTPGNTYEGEVAIFWYELNAAGVISDPTNAIYDYGAAGIGIDNTVVPISKIPSAAVNGGSLNISVMSGNGSNYWILSSLTGSLLGPAWLPGLSALQASQIDGKIDDGFPNTGNVISIPTVLGGGLGGSMQPSVVGDAYQGIGGPPYCTNNGDGTGGYAVSQGAFAPSAVCNITIRASF